MTYRTLLTLVVLACVCLCAPQLMRAAPKALPKVNLIETFDRNKGAWTSVTGTALYTGGNLKLTGDGTNDASVFYNVMPFGEGDFAAKMRRTGCSGCPNGVIIMGYPYLHSLGDWDSGFGFYYDNYGFYRVYKQIAGASVFQSIIKPKTFSYAINRGGWNTLRVQSKGNLVRFIINDVVVYQYVQTERFLEYGYSGIIMSSRSTSDTLFVATAWIRNRVNFGSTR
jgi:hypothetical protein